MSCPSPVTNICLISDSPATLPQPVEDANGDRQDLTGMTVTAIFKKPSGALVNKTGVNRDQEVAANLGITDFSLLDSDTDETGVWLFQVFIDEEPTGNGYRTISVVAILE